MRLIPVDAEEKKKERNKDNASGKKIK